MKNKKLTTEEFIAKSIQVHSNKYEYSKVYYTNNSTKVCIICPEHGEFWQRPADHMNGQGCSCCKIYFLKNKFSMGLEKFIEKSKSIHGNKYDYSKIIYVNNKTNVCIICPEHGEFWQRPDKHICRKQGCSKCAIRNSDNIKRVENCSIEFSNKANLIHNNKYDYSKVNYINNYTKICIICPEHGEFWQIPSSHLSGKRCPKCHYIPILEKEIFDFLTNNGLKFTEQQTFKWLRGKSKPQRLDFYLSEYNIAIECQGVQHFKPVKYFGGEKRYNKIKWRDDNKFKLCKEHNIKIIYYSKENIIPKNFIEYDVITDLNIIKELIKYENEK